MAINNCFYIKNTGTAPITLRNGRDFGSGYKENYYVKFDYSINNTANFVSRGGTASLPVSITLQPNDKVYFKGVETPSRAHPDGRSFFVYNWFGIPAGANVEVGGAVMSLLHDGDGNNEEFVYGIAYTTMICIFGGMLSGGTDQFNMNIDNLKLPTNLYHHYFENFFFNQSIDSVPKSLLSATELAPYCYKNMFHSCSGFTTPPDLPASILAKGCYSGMFTLTSIVVAPNLPATELVEECYSDMFDFCGSLKEIRVNFSNWDSAKNATAFWVYEVAATGDFYCPEGLAQQFDEDHIPEGWTVHAGPIKQKQKGSMTFFGRVVTSVG